MFQICLNDRELNDLYKKLTNNIIHDVMFYINILMIENMIITLWRKLHIPYQHLIGA